MATTQTKSGRNYRAYFNGVNVGLGRMQTGKYDKSSPLITVKELGNPNVAEYVPGINEGSITLDYMLISPGQLVKALGISYGSTTSSVTAIDGVVGEVPDIPGSFDIVVRLISPGTEGTANEVYLGYDLYQGVQIEKESWDLSVDKPVAVNLSAKCLPKRAYEGNNGVAFDSFSATGSQTAFVLSHRSIPGKDGYLTVRADLANGTSLREGFGYTTASTSSNTTVTFGTAPPAGNVNIIYAW